jgi:hypothetical protein
MTPLAKKLIQLPQGGGYSAARGGNPFREQLDREYERGKREAEAAADRRLQERLAALAEESSLARATERTRWASEEAERLSLELDGAMSALEARLQDDIARLLQPFLEDTIRAKAVAGFGDALRALLRNGGARVEISGPGDLVGGIVPAEFSQACVVHVNEDANCEVRATSDATVIETRLRPWLEAIGRRHP